MRNRLIFLFVIASFFMFGCLHTNSAGRFNPDAYDPNYKAAPYTPPEKNYDPPPQKPYNPTYPCVGDCKKPKKNKKEHKCCRTCDCECD